MRKKPIEVALPLEDASPSAPSAKSTMEKADMKHTQQRKRTGKAERRESVSLFERIQPDAAGVDCGQKSHFVAVPPERAPEPVREFRTFTADPQRLAEWLAQCGVKTVAMESTGVYWIPLYQILEQRGFEVVLVNARDVHNVRGRKSDVKDCEWLQQLHRVGLLRASFRPAAAMVPLRSYLRRCAMSLGRTSTALGAFYRRLAARVGKAKAITATARKLAVLVYRVLSGDLIYNDPGATAYHQLNRARELKSLRKRAKLLGFELVDRSSGEVLLNPVS
jgi:hypothetical protein